MVTRGVEDYPIFLVASKNVAPAWLATLLLATSVMPLDSSTCMAVEYDTQIVVHVNKVSQFWFLGAEWQTRRYSNTS